jgi:hypothetical protein
MDVYSLNHLAASAFAGAQKRIKRKIFKLLYSVALFIEQ